ncbi:hypothetical protein ACHAXH_001320 [Discostella pseudostelligera]
MARPGRHPDPRTETAVDELMKDSTMTVPQAMLAAGFSVEECKDRSKQMWVRRRAPTKISMKLDSEPTTSTTPVDAAADNTSEDDSAVDTESDNNFRVRFSITNFNEDFSLASLAEEEEDPLVKFKLRDWISLHRINIEQMQQDRDSSL